jgi:hypothetical protein
MTTVNDLIQIEKRFLRIEGVLDKVSPGWRDSKSDPGQLETVRALVASLGRRGVADMRDKFPGVSDIDWDLALMG